jgi:hypothetical protein
MTCDAIIWTGDDGGDSLALGLYVCMDISGGESEAWDHEVAWQSAWRRHHKPDDAMAGWLLSRRCWGEAMIWSSSSAGPCPPLPPPGDVRVVCAGPERGIAASITELSAEEIP